jgi:hypothetical protein
MPVFLPHLSLFSSFILASMSLPIEWCFDVNTLFMSGGLWQFEQGVQGVQNASMLETNKCFVICFRRQDSSIGFGSPVRANMRGQRLIDAAITSSLLETVN